MGVDVGKFFAKTTKTVMVGAIGATAAIVLSGTLDKVGEPPTERIVKFSAEDYVGPDAIYDLGDLRAQIDEGAEHLKTYMRETNEGNIFAASAEARAAVEDYNEACSKAGRIAMSMSMKDFDTSEMRSLTADICDNKDAVVEIMEEISGPIQQLLSIRNAAQIKVATAAGALNIEPRYDVRYYPEAGGGPEGPKI